VWVVWVWNGDDDPAEVERVAAWCREHHIRPFDVAGRSTIGSNVAEEVEQVASWARRHHVRVLNVAGPSEGALPGIGDWAYRFLAELFSPRPPGNSV
jgi:hypothetical protein